jgi:protein TonB
MEHADSIAPVSFPERISARRERTTAAAWQGVAASLLLHLFVGAVAIGALSGPADIPPLVIDLTLAEPAGERPPTSTGPEEARVRRTDAPVAATRSDGPPALAPSARATSFPAATEPAILAGSIALSDPPIRANRPAAATAASLSGTASPGIAPAAGTGRSRPAAPFSPSSPVDAASGSPPGAAATNRAATGEGGGKETAWNPPGTSGAGAQAGDFSRIRDAIQRGIAYPATARKMGREGKVVVAFRLLFDGSVRDVRIVRGSGHAALDQGAVDAVRNASPFPRPHVEAEVITPVVYRLTPAP